jgi:hypothetical protein
MLPEMDELARRTVAALLENYSFNCAPEWHPQLERFDCCCYLGKRFINN